MKNIAGLWSLHGTNYHSSFTGSTNDTVVVTMTIFQADDTIIVTLMNDYYTVYRLDNTTDSAIHLSGGGATINYNFISQSLFYSYFSYYSMGYNNEQLSSSPPHVSAQNNPITSNTAKMVGTKQWHGTDQNVYIPPDTTYYDTLTMEINALADTLILVRNVGTNFFVQYRVLIKTFDDQSTTVFTNPENLDD